MHLVFVTYYPTPRKEKRLTDINQQASLILPEAFLFNFY